MTRSGFLSPNACSEDLDRRVARVLRSPEGRPIEVVYAYDHCALESFKAARESGRRCIYDLPIGYWRALESLMQEEVSRWPEWRETASALDFRTPIYARKDSEIELADRIIVASSFTKQTLGEHGYLGKPITVIPYGAPDVIQLREDELERSGGPLRVLFVGALELRKGLPYLLRALELVDENIEFTMIGRPRGSCAPLEAAIRRHRWLPSLPHGEVINWMRRSDVLAFPSLFEGSGLVVTEAMSQGCAVITTSHCCGPDIITTEGDGFLVPIRSSEVIAEIICKLARDRSMLRRIRQAAQATVSRLSWDQFRAATLTALSSSMPSESWTLQ